MVKVEGKVDEWKQPPEVLPYEPAWDSSPLVNIGGFIRSQALGLDSLFNPVATEMLLGTLGDARFRALAPIQVKIDVEGSQFIAEAVEFNEFGFGASRSEAIRDLQQALVELYFTLEQERDQLGPDLQKVWESLKAKLIVRK